MAVFQISYLHGQMAVTPPPPYYDLFNNVLTLKQFNDGDHNYFACDSLRSTYY